MPSSPSFRTTNFIMMYCVELLVFSISLGIYILTSSRSIIHGDTGEFLAAAATHGVPHDPGFPLYSIVITFVFFLTKNAWLVNLVSSFFASCTLVLVYRIVKHISSNSIAALFAVVSLGTYEVFWFYALTTQIHTIHIFVQSLLFFFLLRSTQTKQLRFLYLSAWTFGLGVSTHQTIIFMLPSFFLILFSLRRLITIKRIVFLGIVSCLGLLPYLYIFWASSTNPPMNWGRVHDIPSFLYLFFRHDYGVVLLSKPESAAPFVFYPFINYFKQLFLTSWYILPFATYSLILLYKKNVIYLSLFLCFLLSGPFYYFLMAIPIRSVNYQATIEQYFAYSFLFLSIATGIGFHLLCKKFHITNTKYAFSFVCICLFFSFLITFEKVRLDNNTIVEQTTKYQLDQLPQNSVVLTWSDSLYIPALYWQLVQNYRKDITFIQLGMVNIPWYQQYIANFHPEYTLFITSNNFDYEQACKQLAEKDNLFVYPWFSEYDYVFGKDCTIIPYGLVNKVVLKNREPSLEQIKKFNDTVWKTYSSNISFTPYHHSFVRTREALYYIAEQVNYTGLYYLQHQKIDWALHSFHSAQSISLDESNAFINESVISFNKKDLQKAVALLEHGKQRNPGNADIYKNLGIIYVQLKEHEKAYENLKTFVGFHTQDKDLAQIMKFISLYESTLHANSLQSIQ